MTDNKYIRTYYVIGPYDTVYGKFSKLREAKAHLLEMSRNGADIAVLKPCIYKSCENSPDKYDRSSLKYIEDDSTWAYLYFSWNDYVNETLGR